VRLKTFTAPTTTLAMAQIRAVLGDQAIIVATREEGGSVRVTAALDTAAGAHHAAPAPTPDLDVGDAVYEALRRNGIPADVSEPLMAVVETFEPTDPATAFAAAIRQFFQFRPLEETSRRQARMLVGPPGAGKTQTIAKLAARALTLGHRVALFTTDSERTGGDARLAGLAAALGLPLMTVDEPDNLAAGLVGVDGYDLVLIDSAGVNHLDVDEMDSLGRYLLCGDIESILVVPAGIDPVEAGDMAQMFSELGVGRLISTRHDMTRRMGSAVSAARTAKLAFAAFSNTARIKAGLIPADPSVLARIILHGGMAAQQHKAGG
jgi:flagellar biosynthesis protein FlhF